jgi:hypothetical protein
MSAASSLPAWLCSAEKEPEPEGVCSWWCNTCFIFFIALPETKIQMGKFNYIGFNYIGNKSARMFSNALLRHMQHSTHVTHAGWLPMDLGVAGLESCERGAAAESSKRFSMLEILDTKSSGSGSYMYMSPPSPSILS